MLVRWGLDQVAPLLSELAVSAPLVVTTARWSELDLPGRRFHGARPYAEVEGIKEGVRAADGADVLVAVGGGSTLDTAKGISADAKLPLVSVPTTYSGSEWTPFYGMRDAATGQKLRGSGAHPVAIVYEPTLTVELSVELTVGSAMNALNHCAEALYVRGRSDSTDERALRGATLLARALPTVTGDGYDIAARREMLEGAMHAGSAMVEAGHGLAHAMAQALGGRFDVPHGASNALCLAPALRFNGTVAAQAVARFGGAIGSEDAVRAVVTLAELGGFRRLRDFGVPSDGLDEVAKAAVERPGARMNPRPASAEEVVELYRSVW